MPTTMNNETYYSTGEACEYLGVSRETLNTFPNRYGLKKYRKGALVTNYYKLTDLEDIKKQRESFVEADDDVKEN